MEYMGDADWWNKRFGDRELNLMSQEKRLEDDIKIFNPKGKVLDVACGDGRNSIFLAKLGYSVEAIDFSKEALVRLKYFSDREELNIKTSLVDLSIDNPFTNMGIYDYIIINHYRLNPYNYTDLAAHLKESGILWVNGFRKEPVDNPHITSKDILVDNDFEYLENCILDSKTEYEKEERAFVRYIWRKQDEKI